MDNSRMSNADMLQYCDEALAWDDFGPIDIFFFESVKKIILGQCSAVEEPEDDSDDLMGIERPVRDVELEPEYGNYADIYYGEEGDEDIPDYSRSADDEVFSAEIFGNGFFVEAEQSAESAVTASAETNETAADEASAVKKTAKKPSGKTTKKSRKKSVKSAASDKPESSEKSGFTVEL